MAIQAILFDLDDTLIVDEAVSVETWDECAEAAFKFIGADRDRFKRDAIYQAKSLWASSPVHPYCRRIGISAFECLWGNFEGSSADLTALRDWSRGYRVAVMDAALRQQELDAGETAEVLAATFASARRRLQRLMPDAIETLTRLKPSYRFGLLTNGAPDLQREKLRASGLAGFFDAVAVSGEHDIGKPNPEIFHRLLGELGVTTDEAIMVGNSMERDIAGARNAGIGSVWIRVPGSEERDDVEPDATIVALSELPGVISGWPVAVG